MCLECAKPGVMGITTHGVDPLTSHDVSILETSHYLFWVAGITWEKYSSSDYYSRVFTIATECLFSAQFCPSHPTCILSFTPHSILVIFFSYFMHEEAEVQGE